MDAKLQSENYQAELASRYRTTVLVVRGLIALGIILPLIAFAAKQRFPQREDTFFNGVVKITIVICGLGAVVWRRTKFSALRLQDITALKGVTGLLRTLQTTTLQIAALAGVMILSGFISTTLTGNDFYTYGAALVGLVILLYCYPTRGSWERAIRRFAEAAAPPAPPVFKSDETDSR